MKNSRLILIDLILFFAILIFLQSVFFIKEKLEGALNAKTQAAIANSPLADGFPAEYAALKAENSRLKAELTRVTQEKENLKARLNSLAELKKATRQLKRQMVQVGYDLKKKARASRVISGNRGSLTGKTPPTDNPEVKQ